MPDMQESASHHVNDLSTPGFTAKLIGHIRQDVEIDEKTQIEIHNCAFNGKLKLYRPNIFEKLRDCAFFKSLPGKRIFEAACPARLVPGPANEYLKPLARPGYCQAWQVNI